MSKVDDIIIEVRHGRMSNTKAKQQLLAEVLDMIGADQISVSTGDEILELITKDRQAHVLASRIDELERLIGSGAAGDKYRTKAKHGFVTIEERLEQLKEQSNE